MADFQLYFVALVPIKPSSVKSDFKNICISKIHILSTTFFLSLPWFKPVLPAIDRQGEVERYCQAKSPNPNSQVLSLKGLVLADNKINLTLNSIVNKTMHEL